jgi:hypothetical protein
MRTQRVVDKVLGQLQRSSGNWPGSSSPRSTEETEQSLRLKDVARIRAPGECVTEGALFVAVERRSATREESVRIGPPREPGKSSTATIRRHPLSAGSDVFRALRKLAEVSLMWTVERDRVERIVHHSNAEMNAETRLEAEFVEMDERGDELPATRQEHRLGEREARIGEVTRYRPHNLSRQAPLD